jgi:hypothetical protein
MPGYDTNWELTLLDADPPAASQGSLTVGDIDGDGHVEIVVGGCGPEGVGRKHEGSLMWYRPATLEKGLIAEGGFHVGSAAADLDGDGRMEIVIGENVDDLSARRLLLFKAGEDTNLPWSRYVVDESPLAFAHDIAIHDLDGDGELEILANAVYAEVPGVFAYKRREAITSPWKRYEIQTGHFEEGLAIGDVDGDGYPEVLSGPAWYRNTSHGSLEGPWERGEVAPGLREMDRVDCVDITGNGRADAVVVESEYPDGRLSWFENRVLEDPDRPWVEHVLENNVVFGHSLKAWRDRSGRVHIFLGEMAQGGFGAPANRDARLLLLSSSDGGETWDRELVYRGQGTHEATAHDLDGDGEREIAGKQLNAAVQLWKRGDALPPFVSREHRFLDRDKPYTSTDILAMDVDGDGKQDVVTGSWWYENPTWERREIPGIYQSLCACDLDGDGQQELIGTRRRERAVNWYGGLTSELCWLKPVNPERGDWEEHPIGTGTGDWPHGTLVAPVLPGGRLALIVGYHSAGSHGHFPEIFEVPDDPREHPWPRRTLVEIPYGEEFVACDVDGDGKPDIVAGGFWLENLGDGRFEPHVICDGLKPARVAVADLNGDGRPDVVVGEEVLDFERRVTPVSSLVWFENPADPRQEPWKKHVIDKLRCAHSLSAADLDGDGRPEIVVGEHDPFNPYRSRGRAMVYKRVDADLVAWKRYTLDDRFEHHDGARLIELGPGQYGIMSIGWREGRYVHLWA